MFADDSLRASWQLLIMRPIGTRQGNTDYHSLRRENDRAWLAVARMQLPLHLPTVASIVVRTAQSLRWHGLMRSHWRKLPARCDFDGDRWCDRGTRDLFFFSFVTIMTILFSAAQAWRHRWQIFLVCDISRNVYEFLKYVIILVAYFRWRKVQGRMKFGSSLGANRVRIRSKQSRTSGESEGQFAWQTIIVIIMSASRGENWTVLRHVLIASKRTRVQHSN